MNKQISLVVGFLFVSLVLMSVVSAHSHDLRPLDQMTHPGLGNRYHPPADGPNHKGVSDYSNKWAGWSELCEWDYQIRPANQGRNIPKFWMCMFG